MDETKEYLAIMAGHKRLELEYKVGDIVSGYTAYGLHARIIESLHCGQYIDGWGFLVDREFEDGDIHRMKRHFFEWKEMREEQELFEEAEKKREEEEKERILEGVVWTQKESFQMDGSISYIHHIQIEDCQYQFHEKRIAGMGRVVLPEYSVSEDIFGEPLPELIEGNWYWSCIADGKEQKIPMEENEERAYIIVYRYGSLQRR